MSSIRLFIAKNNEFIIPRFIDTNNHPDNARPHTARVTQAYLNDMNITVMEWPARSPDMNPIEHVWDLLKRKVKSRIPAPANVDELRIVVVEEWRRHYPRRPSITSFSICLDG
ncbi:jg15227 [Pararge aegeria aegeria]|uniref:Jg15227 protein n=1 Tax=Pararge aegeria aegeria TaxID=348720 RepID=A0A8S4RD55_9NEOP|nr:jg15227 [Pararge aegeria aegeria]